jgi:hypothetical protein
MKTSLATLLIAAAIGVSGVAFAADPDAHAQHHPATAPAPAAQPQTPPAGQPAMDCKSMMRNGMMGSNGMTGGAMPGGGMQGGAMQGGDKAAGGASGQPMANGMMAHCMKPADGDKNAAQTPPQGAH